MSTFDDLLHARLIADGGFTAIAVDRHYSGEHPADVTAPFVVSRLLSAPRPQAMGSAPGVVLARYEITSFADRPSGARALATAVRLALHRWSDALSTPVVQDVFLDNEFESYDDLASLFTKVQYYLVFHRE